MPENPLYNNIEIRLNEDIGSIGSILSNNLPILNSENKDNSNKPINICFTAPNIISFDYNKLSIISYTSALYIKPALYTYNSTNTNFKTLDKALNILTAPILQKITADIGQVYDKIIEAMMLGQEIASQEIFPIASTIHYRKHLVNISGHKYFEYVIDDFLINEQGIASNKHNTNQNNITKSKSFFSQAINMYPHLLKLRFIKNTAETYHEYDLGQKCIAEKRLGNALENLIEVYDKILWSKKRKISNFTD